VEWRAAWPLAARAQQPLPLVGFISSRLSAAASATTNAAFREGLAQAGYVEGRTVTIEYHYVGGRLDQLPAIVSHMVRSPVSVIFAQSTIVALAVKKASNTMPVVFFTGEDPVEIGLVYSFTALAATLQVWLC
jgi:putative ABC transport system substrate-binding protein